MTTRQSTDGDNVNKGEDIEVQQNDADDDDIVPLVPREVSHFEIASRSAAHNGYDGWTAVGTRWKTLLTAVVLGPLFYLAYEHARGSSVSAESSTSSFLSLLKTADQLSCAKELDISYSELFLNIKLNRTGSCHEIRAGASCSNPTIPKKLTGHWSEMWSKGFERNIQLAESVPADKLLDVVFLGDSITEHWLGTDLTKPRKEVVDVPKLWNRLFDGHALALALSGDRCGHLLYRMKNGEMPDSLNAKAWWILIGTNDYASGNTKEAILAGNLAVLEEGLRRKPKSETRFVLQGLLPRGQRPLLESSAWNHYEWINERLNCLTQANPSQLLFFNGSSYFLTNDGSKIDKNLMFDFLHPSLTGYEIWGAAMVQQLKDWEIWTL